MTKDDRINERAPLEVEVSMDSEHNFYTGITRDISAGGVFVATYDPPPPGTVIELELALPTAPERFRITGIVRWVRDLSASCEGCPPGSGIEWFNISEGALLAIERFVNRRDSLFYDVA